MVWKLLKKNISIGQIVGYAIASLVGLSIVLCAVKFYNDIRSAFNDEESFISKDYIIISKKVPLGSVLGLGSSTTFSNKEIADIKAQPWVRDVGAFEAAEFNVAASLDFNGRGMSTHLFFEAIPDRFFDISPDKWKFETPDATMSADAFIESVEIPVVVSRDYLTLYNFGFAATRGLPQINEKIVESVPISFFLSGNGHRDRYKGRIVGFSSRLNTIAVPVDFMEWANSRYAPDAQSEPSRLIIEANAPGDPRIEQFMNRHSYQVAGDKADSAKMNYFLTVVTAVVLVVGAVITILSFFILMLSIYLLLQKNRRKLHELMLLGYSPAQVARPYYLMILSINVAILVLSIIVTILFSRYWTAKFSSIGIQPASLWSAVVVGAIITFLTSALNCLSVRRIVRRNFYSR